MVLLPSASEAMATARIVWDFEAGTATEPRNLDFCTVNFILLSFFLPSVKTTRAYNTLIERKSYVIFDILQVFEKFSNFLKIFREFTCNIFEMLLDWRHDKEQYQPKVNSEES